METENILVRKVLQKGQRVVLFDELRGVMIVSMLLYHLCYDLAEVVRLPRMDWFYSAAADVWQLSICGIFIFIAGICCSYSQNNLKRGIRLFLLGMLFTFATAAFVPNLLIVFGLLHFLGVAVLLSIPLKKLLCKIPTGIGIVGSLLLFWMSDHISDGWIGFSRQFSIELPSFLYQSNLLCFLGFYNESFYSSDYFPLLPYLFLFWAGMFFAKVSLPQWVGHTHSRTLALLGKNSLWIYLFHQPIMYALLWMIFRF